MNKSPKFGASPIEAKTPKTEFLPELAQKHYASWQFSKIDMDGRWGLENIINGIKFHFNESLIESLPTDLNQDIYNALSELNGKNFKSLDNFLEKLSNECKTEIPHTQLRIIANGISKSLFWLQIIPKLKDFESNNWFDIEKQQFGKKGKSKHHFVAVSNLIPTARKRLEELNLDDHEELFSLRLEGKVRIYGIRQFGYLQIIWIDQNHEIYPMAD